VLAIPEHQSVVWAPRRLNVGRQRASTHCGDPRRGEAFGDHHDPSLHLVAQQHLGHRPPVRPSDGCAKRLSY
jgi:hypothetical protein